MIAEELWQQAIARANSPESMAKLIHAILWQTPTLSVDEREYLLALRIYVLQKRIVAIRKARSYTPSESFHGLYSSPYDVFVAWEHCRKSATRLEAARVRELNREWGPLFKLNLLYGVAGYLP